MFLLYMQPGLIMPNNSSYYCHYSTCLCIADMGPGLGGGRGLSLEEEKVEVNL